MKRFTVFILFLLYLVTSTGAIMNYHFCMGRMAGSSLWENKEKKCSKCGMQKDRAKENGCCRDELQWIKIEDDQKLNSVHFEITKLQAHVVSILLINSDSLVLQNRSTLPENKTPLRSCKDQLYLLHRVFLI